MRHRFVLAFAFLATGCAFAQFPGVPAAPPAAAPTEAGPEAARQEPAGESLDPDTPRGALERFLAASRKANYAEAAGYLDLSRIPEAERAAAGPVLARHLKIVFDHTIWFDLDAISDDPEGSVADGLPNDLERVGQVRSGGGTISVLMRREPAADGGAVWRFTPSLVERIPALYAQFGYGWIGDHVPASLHAMTGADLEIWQLIALAVLILAAWYLGRAIAAVALRVAKPIAARTTTSLDDRLMEKLRRPLRFAAALALIAAGIPWLDLTIRGSAWAGRGLAALAVVVFVLFLAALSDATAETMRERFEREGHRSGAGGVAVANRVVKVLLAFLALTGVLRAFGFNVTGILAGLGIGGIAVALAAQKTLENLFGGLTLMADKPVRIGDFCRFGDAMGWVEDVGLRSTRVKTLDMTMLSVPNAEFANARIENFAGRTSMRFFTTLNLRYETTPDQMRAVLVGLRKLFIGHPKIAPDMLRIRFVALGAASLDIEINSYVRTGDVGAFYAVREDLLLRIVDIVDGAGTGFAFPSQTIYMARDGGVDADKAKETAASIQSLRDAGKLPFPDFPHDEAAELTDRLDYPPRGSALGSRTTGS
jgi:MscS family membrane protein